MKQKELAPDSQAQWEDRIIRDLDYIRKHKHYRCTLKNWLPVLLALAWFGFVVYLLILGFSSQDEPGKSQFLAGRFMGRFAIPVVMIFVLTRAIVKYVRSLYFITLPTSLGKALNHDKLVAFLHQKQLLVYYHPKTSDVVQIISRPINRGDDRREAIVFIVDENRILVNSHFTGTGWRLTLSPRHHRQMASDLKTFIGHHQNSPEKSILKW